MRERDRERERERERKKERKRERWEGMGECKPVNDGVWERVLARGKGEAQGRVGEGESGAPRILPPPPLLLLCFSLNSHSLSLSLSLSLSPASPFPLFFLFFCVSAVCVWCSVPDSNQTAPNKKTGRLMAIAIQLPVNQPA